MPGCLYLVGTRPPHQKTVLVFFEQQCVPVLRPILFQIQILPTDDDDGGVVLGPPFDEFMKFCCSLERDVLTVDPGGLRFLELLEALEIFDHELPTEPGKIVLCRFVQVRQGVAVFQPSHQVCVWNKVKPKARVLFRAVVHESQAVPTEAIRAPFVVLQDFKRPLHRNESCLRDVCPPFLILFRALPVVACSFDELSETIPLLTLLGPTVGL